MEDMTRLAENERLSDITAEAPLTEGSWGRVARYISAVTNPLFVALPTLFLMALHRAPDFLHALLWWAITVVGITVAPLLFIWRGVLYWLLGSSVQKLALQDGERSSSPTCKHRRVGVESDVVDSILMLEQRHFYVMEKIFYGRCFYHSPAAEG